MTQNPSEKSSFPQGGEIWFVNLPNSPSERHQQRTAIIVSTNGRNQYASDVIVVPTASSMNFRPHPEVHLLIPIGEGGLQIDSYALCDQVTTLDKSYLAPGPLGAPIHLQYRGAIIDAIRKALGDTRA